MLGNVKINAIIEDYKFDVNCFRYIAGNRGIDLLLEPGAQVFSPYDGEVFFKGKIDNKHILSIKHKNNIRTTYVGLDSHLDVGDNVKKNPI